MDMMPNVFVFFCYQARLNHWSQPHIFGIVKIRDVPIRRFTQQVEFGYLYTSTDTDDQYQVLKKVIKNDRFTFIYFLKRCYLKNNPWCVFL